MSRRVRSGKKDTKDRKLRKCKNPDQLRNRARSRGYEHHSVKFCTYDGRCFLHRFNTFSIPYHSRIVMLSMLTFNACALSERGSLLDLGCKNSVAD